MQTMLVNLFGGPGVGKTTAMAFIYAELKMRGFECEMVTEFAKELFYEGNDKAFSEQLYILGTQYFRLINTSDNVDLMITDSPILLSTVYNNLIKGEQDFNNLVVKISENFHNVNYLLERKVKYSCRGRRQNEEQANEVSKKVKEKLDEYGLDYKITSSSREDLTKLIDEIIVNYNNFKNN